MKMSCSFGQNSIHLFAHFGKIGRKQITRPCSNNEQKKKQIQTTAKSVHMVLFFLHFQLIKNKLSSPNLFSSSLCFCCFFFNRKPNFFFCHGDGPKNCCEALKKKAEETQYQLKRNLYRKQNNRNFLFFFLRAKHISFQKQSCLVFKCIALLQHTRWAAISNDDDALVCGTFLVASIHSYGRLCRVRNICPPLLAMFTVWFQSHSRSRLYCFLFASTKNKFMTNGQLHHRTTNQTNLFWRPYDIRIAVVSCSCHGYDSISISVSSFTFFL